MARIKISNRIEGATLLLHETSRRFTGAWVRGLNATARTLVPSPGAGSALVAVSLRARMDGSTAFSSIGSGDDIILRYDGTTATIATLETTGFLSQTDRPTRVASAAPAAAYEPLEDTALELYNSGALTGGSAVIFTLTYHVIGV